MKNFNQLTEKQMSKVNGGFIGALVTVIAAAAVVATPAIGVGIAAK